MEPLFVAQTRTARTPKERGEWFKNKAREAGKKFGCVSFRYSCHPTIEGLILIEGWKKRPADQGAIRWSLTNG